MSVDLAKLRQVVAHDYTIAIEAHYADKGMAALRLLAPALDAIHEQLAYELLAGGLTVVTSLDPASRVLPTDAAAMSVDVTRLPGLVQGVATIEVLSDGSLILLPASVDPLAYADRAIVYFFDGADHFVVGDQVVSVFNPTSFPSVWGTPTFFDLGEALAHYRDRIALHCQCPHLASVWHDVGRRWLLRNRPEDTMQASLAQYLISSLRNHKKIEVRREQPVGGTKPPDIKVTWTLTNRIAFIEVKWMGSSVHANEPRVSWRPDEAEANAGAAQLVGYLTDNEPEASAYQTMGFLVVFDGRRDGVDYGTTTITREQALHYLARDVSYDPDYAELRHDFAKPYRFYMYPLHPAA
jgi:hypothetical protein